MEIRGSESLDTWSSSDHCAVLFVCVGQGKQEDGPLLLLGRLESPRHSPQDLARRALALVGAERPLSLE